MKLHSDADLAAMFGISLEDVHFKCRPGGGWPCVKPKRSVWRFTDAMVEQIIAIETVIPARKPATTTARTQRSQSRRAS